VPEKSEEISSKVIKGCINGKSKYQELLYKQFYAYGMSVSLRYAHNRDEAAEILNDAFLKVFNNISKYNVNQQFKPWFRRLIINTAIDNYRKNLKHYNHLDEEKVNEELLDVSILDELEINDFMKLLNQLPENYRLTFNLYEIEGYSHQEIAQMLGIAEGTSRSNLVRARIILQKAFSIYYKKSYAEVV
jgi:RNA polymerase sigma-70 factor (ECF subfamily)